ncbi:MAG: hypothetical protein LBU78_05825, partial [Microbacterium sp.]|nr:hypothetical protein [Microbacterium sp.]
MNEPDATAQRPAAVVLGRGATGSWLLVRCDADGIELGRETSSPEALATAVARAEQATPLWVVRTLRETYPPLLAA